MTELIFICPHCENFIVIKEINCGIFRHGVFINDNKQIDPHETKENCENFIKNKLIYGCGKPFRLLNNNNNWEIEICEYI